MAQLEEALKAQINEQINQAMAVFSLENPTPALTILLQAWESLPVEKQEYDEGYMLSKYITTVYFRINDLVNAQVWQNTFQMCDLKQRNTGESEFMAGKIAYAMGNMDAAKSYFTVANRKSEGRYFTGDGKQYKKLLDKKDIRPTGLKALLNLSEKEFEAKNYGYALSLLYDCLNIDQMNAQVHLRKGQCHFELGEFDHAANALASAYMLEGLPIFETIDGKYFDFLKTKIEIV